MHPMLKTMILVFCAAAVPLQMVVGEDSVPTPAVHEKPPKLADVTTPDQIKAWLKRDDKGDYSYEQIILLDEIHNHSWSIEEIRAIFGPESFMSGGLELDWSDRRADHHRAPFHVKITDPEKQEFGKLYFLSASIDRQTRRYSLGITD